ncbi:B12-binding domain-containing radical SAM protein [Alkaliphilus hydrothermalis]|uniref:Radical SAM superfamily enzyme YgiQ (UPF0313 family) n=1 Tax=Alkaliphilus hydrothermalis TaxID=1482730 RepID=A0ABS2NRE7_9FIRM|nr:radical SAM protein [Alkaliphilus hydrothermalis]MBM7615508.1 radical SAM superfamily enzyme YgiQ (UPF0313 family) [Alkaliphilus hydrothermalis]
MYKRVLLINCAINQISRKKIKSAVSSPNLGMISIASTLLMHGYEVKILDFFVEEISINQFIDILNEFQPEVIGFSVYTRTTKFMEKIIKIIKQIKYNAKIIVGGPHPTFQSKEMLDQYPIDFVIRGEGEFTFIKLLEYLNYPDQYSIDNIKGISYRCEERVVENADTGYIQNLDALPLQAIDLIKREKYSSPFTISTSRGCPGDCVYCASRAMSGHKYRKKTAENIIGEILYLRKKLDTNKFIILDDTFTADEERLNNFINYLIKIDESFTYRIESRGDVLTESMLHSLKDSGCKVVHTGIESGSQEVLNKIGKKINLDESLGLVRYGKDIGLHMVCSFIIGHYSDSHETIEATLELMQDLKKNNIEVSISMCTPFPGTPLYINRDKLGVKLHSHSWEEYDFGNVIISTKHLTQQDLRDYLFKGVELCK